MMASKAGMQGIGVHSGIAEELPFSDDRFDFVLMATTICFVDDVVKYLKEVFRAIVRLQEVEDGKKIRFWLICGVCFLLITLINTAKKAKRGHPWP
jgi:SAM-dependent methyltransferase